MEHLKHCLACGSDRYRPYVQTAAMMHAKSEVVYNFDRCDECGLVFLNPRVKASELSQFYTAEYLPYRVQQAWGRYANFVEGDQKRIDSERVRRVMAHCRVQPKTRILDVGCGKPTFLAALRAVTKAQLIGLDFSDEGWAGEPEKFEALDLRKGEIADLLTEAPMDVITMWHYLEHDYSPKAHLQQLLKLAHPETRLIVEVPNHDSYTRRRFGRHWAGYHTPRHTALYAPNNIKILFEKSGWQVETLQTYGSLDPYTLHWMSKMEQKGIDWSASMEPRFWGYVAGMVLNAPRYLLHKYRSMGFMTVVGRPQF